MPAPADAFREADPRHRLIVALDVAGEDAALRLADQLRPELCYVKVGLELFSACGPAIVRRLAGAGLRVFLDLKLHDIPATVAGAAAAAERMGARMCTVHAGGGVAVAAALAGGATTGAMAVLAVTVLTSHAEGELQRLYGTPLSTAELVLALARAALGQGATGLVASAHELPALRAASGPRPLLVIPGIRPKGDAQDDQQRTATPARALRDGADFLVIGRPITQAKLPRDAARRILDEMSTAV